MCDCVTGSFEYSGPTTELAGKKIHKCSAEIFSVTQGIPLRLSVFPESLCALPLWTQSTSREE